MFFIRPLHNKERFGAIAPGFQAHILAGLFDCLTLFRLFLDVQDLQSAKYENGGSYFVQIDLTRCVFSSEKMQSYCLGWLWPLYFWYPVLT